MPIASDYTSVPIPSTPFHETLLAALRDHISSNNKTAFICAEGHSAVSFKTVYDTSHAVASFLHRNRFQHKDVACMVLPNHWTWAPVFLGVAMNGGVLTGINSSSTEYEIKRQFDDCDPKVVLTNQNALSNVLSAARNTSVEHVICIQDHPGVGLPSGVHCWHRDVTSTPTDAHRPKPWIDLDRDAVFMPYSSGTTGTPKGVMITHRNFGAMMNIYREQQRLHGTGALSPPFHRDTDKTFLLLPFYHCYGFALLMASLLNGNTSVVMSHFQPALFCDSIQRYRIRFVAVAPPILVFLSKSAICAKYDLSSLEFIMVGAAPTGRDLCEELHRKYKTLKYIHQGYGMSEATMATHMPDIVNGQPFGSVGKILSNLEMKIIDPETGAELGRGERGEVCIRGPTVMLGYYRNPQATRDTVKDGWLHTGDVGYVDERGYLYVVDRLKELIKVKGFQVPPAELEGILLSHPEIHDAAVVGVPDGDNGEVPKAYVVRADASLREEHVKGFIREKVSAYKQLAGGVEFVESIPKSPAGKILRRLLRDHHKSKSKL